MTLRQKWLILAVILLPGVIGLCIMLSGNSGGAAIDGWRLPTGKKIGLVRITDVIYSSERYVQQLRDFRDDNSIAGVILRINSPGGTVAPSQEIFTEVNRYRTAGKPLIVSMENVAASGGYYIAAAAARIFADPGTLTGSFGVYMRFPHYYKLSEKVGLDWTTIKAGRYKDMGNPHRAMTKEEESLLQKLIDDTHEQFISDIAHGRSIPIDSIRQIADGRIFTGRQALALGLVDTLGGFQDAVAYLKQRLNLPEKTRIIEKKYSAGLWRTLLEDAMHYMPALRELRMPAGAYYLYEG